MQRRIESKWIKKRTPIKWLGTCLEAGSNRNQYLCSSLKQYWHTKNRWTIYSLYFSLSLSLSHARTRTHTYPFPIYLYVYVRFGTVINNNRASSEHSNPVNANDSRVCPVCGKVEEHDTQKTRSNIDKNGKRTTFITCDVCFRSFRGHRYSLSACKVRECLNAPVSYVDSSRHSTMALMMTRTNRIHFYVKIFFSKPSTSVCRVAFRAKVFWMFFFFVAFVETNASLLIKCSISYQLIISNVAHRDENHSELLQLI